MSRYGLGHVHRYRMVSSGTANGLAHTTANISRGVSHTPPLSVSE
jgi:hypothetical protein